jgi:EAL domain-containing protein (putative c-di-GMP-specific phosphodiesterase class I)
MSIVRAIDADPKKQSIVRSMAKLCEELRVVIISEGVETALERDALSDVGCDLLQGYLFARPDRGFPVPRW